MESVPKASAHSSRRKEGTWRLRLYILGNTPKAQLALSNIERVRKDHLSSRCQIKVVDLHRFPHLAHSKGIVAIPTLICEYPAGKRRLIGDLSDTPRVLQALGLEPSARVA